jgi:predicted permease
MGRHERSSITVTARRWSTDLGYDITHALRMLRRKPAFALVSTTILAITLGANTAMFSLVHRILLSDLPVHNPERLVVLSRGTPREVGQLRFDYPFYRELHDALDVFDDVLCRAIGNERVTVGTEGGGEAAVGELVCGSYFDMLGVRPHLGRLITRRDDVAAGAHPVVVMSHDYWQRRFAGDPSIVGQTIRITGLPMTIIGVLPPGFTGLDPGQSADLRFPLSMAAEVRAGPQRRASSVFERGRTDVMIVGRLRNDVTITQAEQALTSRLKRYLDAEAPGRGTGPANALDRVHLEPAQRGIGLARQQYQTSLRVLLAVTASVLVIACLNLANLFFARVLSRRGEFSTRFAIGADSARIVRQLLAETLLLALTGGALGVLLAYPGAAVLVRLASPQGAASMLPTAPSAPVLLFHLGTALVSACALGLLPALAARRFASTAIRERNGPRTSGTVRRFFLGAQVAVSIVVLVAAALFVRTERALRAIDPGFDSDRVVALALSPQNAGASAEQTLPFFRRVRERVSAVPGVTGVTYGWVRPLANAFWRADVVVEGCCPDAPSKALRNAVGPGYFSTLGIPIIAGREFTDADHSTAPRVAIVNETFARMYGGGSVLGSRIGVVRPEYTIVGIARNAKYAHLRESPGPVWYVPYEQQPNVKYLDLYARTPGDPAAIIASIRSAIASIDPQVALFEPRPLQAEVDRLLVVERMLAALVTCFGTTGAALAGLGLYGMLAWLLMSRTREIALRLALGARPAAVVLQVTAEVWKALAVGAVIGTGAAVLLSRFVATLLFGVAPLDPVSFGAGVLSVAALVTLAAIVPVCRASRTDPIRALRDV